MLDRLAQLSSDRSGFEAVWDQVDAVAATHAAPGGYGNGQTNSGLAPAVPHAALRSKKLYDSTGINCVDRLGSGIEALIIPQSEFWHELGISSLQRGRRSLQDSELAWLEDQRNLLFEVRYDADSGWVSATQAAIRGCISHGTGLIWSEEGFDNRAFIEYRFLPLRECYLAQDFRGIVNCFYRYYTLTAEQAALRFGDRCPAKIKEAANVATTKDKQFRFVQAVSPRGDYGYSSGIQHSRFRSVHIAEEEKQVCEEKGFYEFPVTDFRWLPEGGQVWGEGPVMKVLSDIQSLQVMARNELLAGEQSVRPPLLVANAGVMNRPNSTPGAQILGGINAQGQRMVDTLFNGQRLDFATMVLEAKRNQVKESMYLNLFALLVQNPQMSATEALIRANEKGELLGPAGSRLQQSLSRLVDRELNILIRKGLYDANSDYRVPEGLQGKTVQPQMTGPLNRLRKAKETEGTLRLLEAVTPLAAVEQEVVDNFDADETVRALREGFGAPIRVLRDPKVVAQRRAARQQTQAMANNAAIAKDMAAAGKQTTDAIAGMKQAGVF
jgi:hypothetical protein